MEINDKTLNLENIIEDSEKSFTKLRENGLLLSDNQISILDRYHIDYKKCIDIKELIYMVEDEIDNGDSDEDLEYLADSLSEFNYYHYTNK